MPLEVRHSTGPLAPSKIGAVKFYNEDDAFKFVYQLFEEHGCNGVVEVELWQNDRPIQSFRRLAQFYAQDRLGRRIVA
ncbi:hypothetical protein [Nitrobacter sp.]|uniref:hypothetical protein n=1 Tax=Nitrobacter sp. TaxID=29420 RepID=UPI003F6536FF